MRTLALARTIADMEQVPKVGRDHLCEAIGFRLREGGACDRAGRREGHGVRLAGMRTVLLPDDPRFPAALRVIPRPPKRLYVLGDPEMLTEGLGRGGRA